MKYGCLQLQDSEFSDSGSLYLILVLTLYAHDEWIFETKISLPRH